MDNDSLTDIKANGYNNDGKDTKGQIKKIYIKVNMGNNLNNSSIYIFICSSIIKKKV